MNNALRKAIKKIAFGGDPVPQRIFLAQQSPQKEVAVWLHGMGAPLDVTYRHSMACAVPFMLCLAFNGHQVPSEKEADRLSLKFCEQDGERRVLGEIGLKLLQKIPLNGREFLIFGARSTDNYCMPAPRLWAHYLLYARAEKRANNTPDVTLSFLGRRAMEVMFICPRPISLVSVITDIKGNMFPVNVMGDIDSGYFTFSLRSPKIPAHLVADAGRLALSSVPFEQGSFAYQMGVNHNKQSINWYELPFETRKSKAFEIPVPVFSYRVREMEIEEIQPLGSHTMFIARVVSDENYSQGQELFVVHGFYEAWRLRKSNGEWATALNEDARIKAGAHYKSSPV
jgi:Flavin reductase like domain